MNSSTGDLGHLPQVLRRHPWSVLAGILLGLLGALLYLQLEGGEVTATTTVDVNVISKDPFGEDRSAGDRLDAATEAQIATSTDVLTQAAAAVGGDASARDLGSRTTASVEPGSTIMRISHTAEDTAAAVAGADAVAQAYLDHRGQRAAERVEAQVGTLEEQRDTLRGDLLRINAVIRQAGSGSLEAVQAQTSQQLVTAELEAVSGEITSFLGLDTSGGSILRSAELDQRTEGPSAPLVLMAGLALGLLLGILAALAAQALRRGITDEDDVRQAGGGRVLGVLTGTRARIPASEEDAEALRAVREVLLATLPEPPVVAIKDLTTGDSVSDVAVNLASLVAETGRPCQLVVPDGDVKTIRRIAEGLMLTPAPDSDIDVRRFVGAGGLVLVAPGRRPLRMDSGVPAWPYDRTPSPVTIIAVPAEASHSSLMSAGRLGHTVVLVASEGGTSKATVAEVAREVGVVGARVHGTVLVPQGRTPALGVLTGEAAYAPYPG